MKRGAPLRRTPLKRLVNPKRKPLDNEFSPQVKAEIRHRSGGRCEARTPICEGGVHHIHHIRRRSQGGKGTVDNGLGVCRYCHAFIHANPAISEQHGWLKRSGHP